MKEKNYDVDNLAFRRKVIRPQVHLLKYNGYSPGKVELEII